MGFFKNIFKKKKGGTLFGNLIRGVANKASGGVLGNGEQLAKWEAEQAQKEQEAMVQQQILNSTAYKAGSVIGAGAQPTIDKVANSDGVQDAKQTLIMAWLKANAMKIVLPVILLTILIIWLIRRNRTAKKGGAVRYKQAK